MKTSEVLYEAANLIELRGWTRVEGWVNDDASGALCLEGGIQAAAGIRLSFEVPECPAYRAVLDYLGPENCRSHKGNTHVWVWNDTPHRTADEVIATLRAAAVIEAAKEQAAVDTPAVSVAPVRSAL